MGLLRPCASDQLRLFLTAHAPPDSELPHIGQGPLKASSEDEHLGDIKEN